MNYTIHLIVTDEMGEIVCELSTDAGIADLEENLVRKAEHAIQANEGKLRFEEQMEQERIQEEIAEHEDSGVIINTLSERD